MRQALLHILLALLLAGCEQLGIEDPAKLQAAREAEGRAIGSACRHSGRALEECYSLNKKASKAAIFSGWRDMDAYMRENNIDIIPPPDKNLAAPVAAPAPAEADKADAEAPKPGAAAAPGRKTA